VAYHLAAAGRGSDLRKILVNFDYLLGKFAHTDVNALIADYDYLPKDADLRTVQPVLRHSAHILAGSSRELPGQLVGRLPESLTQDIDALRSQASEHKGFPWLRPLKPSLAALTASLIRTLQGQYRLSHCRGSHTRWSSGGLRLRRRDSARLGPGDGADQNDTAGP